MSKSALFALAMFFFVSPIFASSPEENITALIADGCIEPIARKRAPIGPFSAECFPKNSDPKFLDIPERVLNWGSNGLSGLPWQFKAQKCNLFYYDLHTRIVESNNDILLTPHDLFHAHLIGYGVDENRLLMVFHAKEYPSDLEEIKNYYQVPEENFSTASLSFEHRNFIYLSDLNGGREIYKVLNQGACTPLFSRWGPEQLVEKKIMKLLPYAKNLGDVNVFNVKNIKRINYKFYSGEDHLGKITYDLEAIHAGKSVAKRITSDLVMNAWLKNNSQNPILYFLSGL